MTDLRKAAQDVLARWDTPKWKDAIDTSQFMEALREALAEPSPIDALIAEIDAMRKYTHSDDEGYQEDEFGDNVDVDDLKDILDKYRSK